MGKKKNRDREAIKAEFRAVKKALKKLLNAMKANIDNVDKFDKSTSSKKWKKQFKWIALRKIIKKGFKKMKVNVRNIFRKVGGNKAFKMSDLVKDVQNVGFFKD